MFHFCNRTRAIKSGTKIGYILELDESALSLW